MYFQRWVNYKVSFLCERVNETLTYFGNENWNACIKVRIYSFFHLFILIFSKLLLGGWNCSRWNREWGKDLKVPGLLNLPGSTYTLWWEEELGAQRDLSSGWFLWQSLPHFSPHGFPWQSPHHKDKDVEVSIFFLNSKCFSQVRVILLTETWNSLFTLNLTFLSS